MERKQYAPSSAAKPPKAYENLLVRFDLLESYKLHCSRPASQGLEEYSVDLPPAAMTDNRDGLLMPLLDGVDVTTAPPPFEVQKFTATQLAQSLNLTAGD